MKVKAPMALAALAALAPGIAQGDPHADMVMQHGAQVMPFDTGTATHMFLTSATGGVVEVIVRNMDQRQITLVRSHLLKEAAKFAGGDYSDPAYIHGRVMPGLSALESGAAKVSVRYFETPTGAAIEFISFDETMVSAIHRWLAAQTKDHGAL